MYFPDLNGDARQTLSLTHRLISVAYRDLQVTGQAGTAHWECDYEFRKKPESTPRPVHNIDSKFRFEGGLIRAHEDACDFWSWFEQAMGPLGVGARAVDFIEDTIEQVLNGMSR